MNASSPADSLQHTSFPWRWVTAAAWVIVAAGIAIAPDRTWPSLLVAGFGLTGVALAGVFVVALQRPANACWIRAFSRVPEAMAGCLPYAAAVVMAVLVFRPSMYPGSHGEQGVGAMVFKEAWMTRPFFLARAAFYLVAWVALARMVVSASRRYDVSADDASSRHLMRWSVAFIVVFAITFSLASFDWVMSLDPGWASTMFGIYSFSGLFASGLAAIAIFAVRAERVGALRGALAADHRHDLGKLLFAFSTFWMYIWFSQYMLIWYANITEETLRYTHLQHRYWLPLFILNVILNWVFPFLALLNKRTKRTGHLLARVAAVVLVGRWLDVYLMVQPAAGGENPTIAVWDIGAVVAASALFVLLFIRGMRQASPVPAGDPRLAESLHYHN